MKTLKEKLFSRKRDKENQTINEIGLPTNVVRGIHVSKNQLTGDLEGLPRAWTRLLKSTITEDEQAENPSAGKRNDESLCHEHVNWTRDAFFLLFLAYQAVKFYNYSIKKKDNVEPFKPFITEEAIVEESAEIDEFLNAKNAHNSEDSFGDSSDENFQHTLPEVPPELPPPLPKKSNTMMPPQKPALLPKPAIMPKPTRVKTAHKAMEDLRLIDDKGRVSEVNDNHLYSNTKSAIVEKKTDFSTSTDNSNNNTFIVHDRQSSNDDEPILRSKKPSQRQAMSDEEVYIELKKICNLTDPLNKYSKTKEVGKGASGIVFIASDLESQKQVAIKTIDLKNQSSKELILNEIRVLIDFNHKNLVNFLEAYYIEELDTLWVVLEYMGG